MLIQTPVKSAEAVAPTLSPQKLEALGSASLIAKVAKVAKAGIDNLSSAKDIKDDSSEQQCASGGASRNGNPWAQVLKELPQLTRITKSTTVVEETIKFYEQLDNTIDWNLQWDTKSRKRQFDLVTTKLQAAGRRVGAIADIVEAGDASTQCFNISEKLEQRHNLIEKLKHSFFQLIANPITRSVHDMLETAPQVLLGRVLVMQLHGAVNHVMTNPSTIDVFCRCATINVKPFKDNTTYLSLGILSSSLAIECQCKVS